MRIQRVFLAFVVISWLSSMGLAGAQAAPPVSSAEFARSASEHFTSQLEAARAAQTKSKDAAVQNLASQLAADYQQAGRVLAKICEELNIDLLPQPSAGQATAGAAATTPESSFDRVYTLEVSQSLAKAETSFDAAVRSPKVDPKLKDFARERLEAIRKYRQQAAPLARSQAGQGSR